jgi:hypothetical protein
LVLQREGCYLRQYNLPHEQQQQQQQPQQHASMEGMEY